MFSKTSKATVLILTALCAGAAFAEGDAKTAQDAATPVNPAIF